MNTKLLRHTHEVKNYRWVYQFKKAFVQWSGNYYAF